MNNEMYIRRRKRIILTKKDNAELDNVYIATLLKNIESLGFTFSKEIVDILKTYSMEDIENFHHKIVCNLRMFLGAHVVYEPMYPNFPKQIMQASEAELYTNAMLHYFGDLFGVRILPAYKKDKRDSLQDAIKLKVVKLGSIDDFNVIFTRLIASKTSISDADKNDIEWFVKYYKDDIEHLLPEDIPLKENITFLGKLLAKYAKIADSFLKKYLKTATDILRYVTVLFEGDVSLAKNTKFKSIKRRDRRLILSLLESCNSITEDMLRYKEQWKRVGERLHPFEYKEKYPKCYEAFDIIRNNKPFATFNRQVEGLLRKKDIDSLVELLKNRPGEFARRLDHILRLSLNADTVISSFSDIASKISSPVLLQVLTHFKYRNQRQELRIFFPKGNVSKVQAIANNLPKIDEGVRQKVVAICKEKLIEKYKKLRPLGKVYLDTNLKKYTVPLLLRPSRLSQEEVS